MQAGVGLLDTDVMPMFMIIALDVIIIMRFSINCSALICSPTIICAISREAISETYGPPGLFSILLNLVYILLVSDLLFCNLYFPIYKKNTKNIYFTVYLSLSDLTFASDREGIDNPFIALVQSSCLFVQVFRDLCVVSYLIDTLVLKTEGNTYATLLHHPFLFKGKPTHAQEVARRIYGTVVGETYA